MAKKDAIIIIYHSKKGDGKSLVVLEHLSKLILAVECCINEKRERVLKVKALKSNNKGESYYINLTLKALKYERDKLKFVEKANLDLKDWDYTRVLSLDQFVHENSV